MNSVTEELIKFGVTGYTHEVPDFTQPELVDEDLFVEDNGQGFQKYFTSEEAVIERQLGYDLEPWYMPLYE
jgi:hypothetical protein